MENAYGDISMKYHPLIVFVMLLCLATACRTIDTNIPSEPEASFVYAIDISASDTEVAIREKYQAEIIVWDAEEGFAIIKTQGLKTSLASLAEANEESLESPVIAEGAAAAGLTAWNNGFYAFNNGLYAFNNGFYAFNNGVKATHLDANTEVWQDIGLFQAHSVAPNLGEGVTVAVIDNGIDLEHPLFEDRLSPTSRHRDYIDDDRVPQEEQGQAYGHGTAVASLILQVAPRASILPIRVLDEDGRGDTDVIARALNYAIRQEVDIINLSLGAEAHSPPLYKMLRKAARKGIYVVAAAGNTNDPQPDYPARYSQDTDSELGHYLISVASLNAEGEKSSFSSYGAVDVSAPGENLGAALPNGSLSLVSGTSMATPLVSGALALLLAEYDIASVEDREFSSLLTESLAFLNDSYYYQGLMPGTIQMDKILLHMGLLGGTLDSVFAMASPNLQQCLAAEGQQVALAPCTPQTVWQLQDEGEYQDVRVSPMSQTGFLAASTGNLQANIRISSDDSGDDDKQKWNVLISNPLTGHYVIQHSIRDLCLTRLDDGTGLGLRYCAGLSGQIWALY